MVGLSRPAQALHHGRAIGFALANAVVIAAYTFVDGSGVRITVAGGQTAASYVVLLFVLDGIPYPALVFARRSAEAPPRHRWPMRASAGRWPRWAGWPRWARTGSRCGP